MIGSVGERPKLMPMKKWASQEELVERNLKTLEVLHKVASYDKEAQDSVRKMLAAQIYESSTCEQVHPPARINWTDLERDENPQSVFKICDKEYLSPAAVALSFRGQSYFHRVETLRYRVDGRLLESPDFYLKEQEIYTMTQPIESVIRTQGAFHLRKLKDMMWYGMLEEAIAISGQVLDFTGKGVTQLTPQVITKTKNLIDGRGSADGKYLKAANIVMAQTMYNTTYNFPQNNGDAGAGSLPGVYMQADSKWLESGFTGKQLHGMNVITTIKEDLLPSNIMYVMTSPEFIGDHFSLNDEKMYVKREYDRLTMRCSTTWLYGIGNAYSVAKVILDTEV